jgi:hypothetical protein
MPGRVCYCATLSFVSLVFQTLACRIGTDNFYDNEEIYRKLVTISPSGRNTQSITEALSLVNCGLEFLNQGRHPLSLIATYRKVFAGCNGQIVTTSPVFFFGDVDAVHLINFYFFPRSFPHPINNLNSHNTFVSPQNEPIFGKQAGLRKCWIFHRR